MFFLLTLIFLLSLYYPISPVLALAAGFVVSATGINKHAQVSTKISRSLMGLAIIALGFTVSLSTISIITEKYLFVTLSSIFLTILFGWYFGRKIGIDRNISVLISAGTAICGASAIAAVSNGIKAKPHQVSIALAVVLIFNALALVLFPFLGHILKLSPDVFGAWAGLAIHDTSSVVGAALQFSSDSVSSATTTKLARAIWISPLVIIFTYIISDSNEKKVSFKVPWFIWGYLLAATSSTFYPLPLEIIDFISIGSRRVFSFAIFLIGAAVDFSSLKQVSLKPFILGLGLWALSAIWSLALVF